MRIKVALASLAVFLTTVAPVFAGGGLVEMSDIQSPNGGADPARPGQFFTVKATARAGSEKAFDDPDNRCKQCLITFFLDNPESGDQIQPSSDKTNDSGEATARISSNDPIIRYVYVQVHLPDSNVYTSSKAALYFTAPPETPKSTIAPTIKPPVATIKPTILPKPTSTPKPTVKPTSSPKIASNSAKPVAKVVVQENRDTTYDDFVQGFAIWFKSVFSFFR